MADAAVTGRLKGMEFVENPFTVNGVLSQKADYIITHSTITRTEIHIADPDCIPAELPQNVAAPQENQSENIPVQEAEKNETNPDYREEIIVTRVVAPTECPPVVTDNNVLLSQNLHPSVAKVETVEAEVKKVDAAIPQCAEEVRLKKKRCCSVL